jgi:predicted metalloprotease with PDZ domain
MKIYWSGAAIALLADIELRERSGGQESLDLALDRLQQCCLPSKRTWSGPDLFSKLDSLVDDAVFVPLYQRYANEVGFPDTQSALARLGVETDGRTILLRPNAELADIRVAITSHSNL